MIGSDLRAEPMPSYGYENISQTQENVMEMKRLTILCVVHWVYGWMVEEVGHRVGVCENNGERLDRKVLKWFGHVEHMSWGWYSERVHESEVEEKGMEAGVLRCSIAKSKGCIRYITVA